MVENTNKPGGGMSQDKPREPAQVPGDAESPPKGGPAGTTREAIRHTDPTEPTPAAKDR